MSIVKDIMIAYSALPWALLVAGLASARPTDQVAFETAKSPRPLVIWYV